MSEHVYSASVFWALVEAASGVAYWIAPFLFLIGCSFLVLRYLSFWRWVALLGAILSVGERIARFLSQGIHWVYLGGRQPTVDQNPFELFFFLHGGTLGYALVATGLIGLVVKNARAA